MTEHNGTGGEAFGAGRLFLADARLAILVANHVRYLLFARLFGAPRAQANLLTFVFAVGAAEVGVGAARRALHIRPHVSDAGLGASAFALREAGLSVAGPGARAVPGFPTLLAIGVLGGVALPSARRAARRVREAESRVRVRRSDRYAAARDGLARERDA